eukprot:1162019-Pelagomonas_calceolata.AAC.5
MHKQKSTRPIASFLPSGEGDPLLLEPMCRASAPNINARSEAGASMVYVHSLLSNDVRGLQFNNEQYAELSSNGWPAKGDAKHLAIAWICSKRHT